MFNFLKRPVQAATPLEAVKKHMKALGYTLSDQGVAAAQLQLDSGMAPVAVAAHFAVITMADELKRAGAAATGILRFRPQATELLERVTAWRDDGELDAATWQQLYESIIGISSINEQQEGWIEQVLQQPAARHVPLAHHTPH
jgi:hypothetical protein